MLLQESRWDFPLKLAMSAFLGYKLSLQFSTWLFCILTIFFVGKTWLYHFDYTGKNH